MKPEKINPTRPVIPNSPPKQLSSAPSMRPQMRIPPYAMNLYVAFNMPDSGRDTNDFVEVFNKLVRSGKIEDPAVMQNLLLASELLLKAISAKHPSLQGEINKDLLSDIRVLVTNLSFDKVPTVNKDTVSKSLEIIEQCALNNINFELDGDNPKTTQTAIIIGQKHVPLLSARAALAILEKTSLMMNEHTFRACTTSLLSTSGTPEEVEMFAKLAICAYPIFFGVNDEDGKKFISISLDKLCKPDIYPGQKDLIDVAERVKWGLKFARDLAKQNKPFLDKEKERVSYLSHSLNNVRIVAVKLRLLNALNGGKGLTNENRIHITESEKVLAEGRDKKALEKLSNDIHSELLEVVAECLAPKKPSGEIFPKYQLAFPLSYVSSAKSFELILDDRLAKAVFNISKTAIEIDRSLTGASVQSAACFLAEQRNPLAKALAIDLALLAHNTENKSRLAFSRGSLTFLDKNTKTVALQGHRFHAWRDLVK